MRKEQVKRETTLPKIRNKKTGRLKGTNLTTGGTVGHVIGASQADSLCAGERGRDVENCTESRLTAQNSIGNLRYVPVVDEANRPLMPTTPARARKWIRNGKGTGFWKIGIYCVRLNVVPSGCQIQQVACGIDTGSKKEAITLKSKAHTYLNAQLDAVTWVKEHVKERRMLRRHRRYRTTPYRKNKYYRNINKNKIAPSTKSRWDWKLRVIKHFMKVIPITDFCIEDICAINWEGKKKWNKIFSPLQTGKNYFYDEIKKLGTAKTLRGSETSAIRNELQLRKISKKTSPKFEAHNVDSWVLANYIVGGHIKPDNKDMIYIKPLKFHRRKLHFEQFAKGGVRRKYGGTMSMGFKRGSLVIHLKYGITYVGGTSNIRRWYIHNKTGEKRVYFNERISVHSVKTGERVSQQTKPSEVKFLCYNTFLINGASKIKGKKAKIRHDICN